MKFKQNQNETNCFKVYVAENSHFEDEGERYLKGEYTGCETAVAVCKRIVDDFLLKAHSQGKTEEELWREYTMYGEDPYIVASEEEDPCRFSAWDYAKDRIREIIEKERL